MSTFRSAGGTAACLVRRTRAVRAAAQTRATQAAARRGGVLRACDLPAAQLSRDAAERAGRSGEWQRPARAVYVPHNRVLSPLELGRAAAAYVAAPYVLTGLLVLHLLELRWLPALDDAHVLVSDLVRRPSSLRVRVQRTQDGLELGSWSRGGLRLAAPERAVVDAARATMTLRDVRGIVLGAVADRHAAPAELLTMVDAGQRNGSALVRRAVRDAQRGCASPPEAELVDALVGGGVPFLVNPELYLGELLVGSPDVWVVGTAVCGEVESVERHGSDALVESTYERHERFVGAGLEPVHLGVRRIRRSPGEAAGHLLGRARASTAPVPPGLRVVPRGPILR